MGEVYSIITRKLVSDTPLDSEIQDEGKKVIKTLYETLKDANATRAKLACLIYAANNDMLNGIKERISDGDLSALHRFNDETLRTELAIVVQYKE